MHSNINWGNDHHCDAGQSPLIQITNEKGPRLMTAASASCTAEKLYWGREDQWSDEVLVRKEGIAWISHAQIDTYIAS